MRIAISGSHQTGKTTLIDELAGSLPTFSIVEEPYYLLEEEGHVFADTPGLEDFALQLERSIRSILESDGDVLFDRCPLDVLAYLRSHDEAERFDLRRWMPAVRDAMQRLDLIVFVPIEAPDQVPAAPEHVDLRRQVHEELQRIVFEDPWTSGVPVIGVTGSPEERARQVLGYVAPRPAGR